MAPERREQEDFAKSSASSGLIAGGAAPATAAVGQAKADSGQATAESPDATRRRVRADVRLYPESWIRKIRTRLKQGDTAGARASLKLFVETYPQEAVPENLKPLLGE
jgi:TolA-binding protein